MLSSHSGHDGLASEVLSALLSGPKSMLRLQWMAEPGPRLVCLLHVHLRRHTANTESALWQGVIVGRSGTTSLRHVGTY
jgi:hypothetical protein